MIEVLVWKVLAFIMAGMAVALGITSTLGYFAVADRTTYNKVAWVFPCILSFLSILFAAKELM